MFLMANPFRENLYQFSQMKDHIFCLFIYTRTHLLKQRGESVQKDTREVTEEIFLFKYLTRFICSFTERRREREKEKRKGIEWSAHLYTPEKQRCSLSALRRSWTLKSVALQLVGPLNYPELFYTLISSVSLRVASRHNLISEHRNVATNIILPWI